MNDKEFRTLLDLWMVNDPFPLPEEQHETFNGLLNREAQKRGYDAISIAYHKHSAKQEAQE